MAHAAVLDVVVTATPDPVESGDTMDVFVTVANRSATASGEIRLEMPFLDALVGLPHAGISDGGICTDNDAWPTGCSATETIFWTLGSLPAGAEVTVSLVPTVAAEAPATITLAVEAFEDGESRASDMRAVEVVNERRLTVAIEPESHPQTPGSRHRYRVVFANRSGVTISNTRLQLSLPDGLQFASAGGEPAVVGNEVSWDIGTLANGNGDQLSIEVEADAAVDPGGLRVIEATLTGEAEFTGFSARDRLAVRAAAPVLELAISAHPDPVRPGELLPTRITVTNRSAAAVQDVAVELQYPPQFARLQDQALLDGGDCSDFDNQPPACGAGEIVSWDIGTLPAGGGQTVSIAALVNGASTAPPDGELIRLVGRARAGGITAARAFRSVRVESDRRLEIALDADRDPAAAGETLSYRLSFGNRRNDAVGSATLEFVVPPGTTFVSATGDPVIDGDRVQWTLGTLAPNSGGRQEVTVQLDDAADGDPLLAEALVHGEVELVTHLARATTTSRVAASNPLELVLEVPERTLPEDDLPLRMVVSNRSMLPVFNVELRLLFPQQLATIPHTDIPDGGVCAADSFPTACSPGETVIWSLGGIAAGASRSVTLPAVVEDSGTVVEGSLVRLAAVATSDTFGRALDTATVPVEDEPAPRGDSIFRDGFEPGGAG